MKTSYIGLTLAILAHTPLHAVTIFTNGTTDFNNASNWDNGLPDNDAAVGGVDLDAEIAAGSTAVTSGSYNATGSLHYNLDVLGELTVSSGHTVHLGTGGGYNTGTDLTVNGGTLNLDGKVTIIGGGAHTFVTNGGVINLRAGGDFDGRKNLNLTLGTLDIASNAVSADAIDHLNVGNGSMIRFDIVSTAFSLVALGNDLDLSATGATLDLDITGATAGDSYTLFTTGGAVDGTFSTFNYTINDSLVATLDYSVADELTVNITAVPEPSSAALLALGGIALTLRRRK
ncbi:MAG: PEP-CTERM sorting domain-containing protein [Akkermansiaceae bacterium]